MAHRKWHALPALDVFSDLLSPEIAVGRTIVDPTRFVIDRTASRRYPELCYVTTRLAVLASEYFSTDLLLATVRAEHQAFYRRVFGHRLACEPRHYPLLSKPICLMALDYPLACERLLQRQPFFRSTVFERRTLFARARLRWPGGRRPDAVDPAAKSVASAGRVPQSGARGEKPAMRDHGWEERQMSADGTWKLAMKTPLGERKATLALKSCRRRAHGQDDQRGGQLH